MTLYYILVFLLFIGVLLSKFIQFSSYGRRKFLFALLMFFLVFFACARDRTVGQDTRSYIALFRRISYLDWHELISFSSGTRYEIGYVLYNKILSLISSDEQIITICNSFIFLVLAGKFLSDECYNPIIGLYLFFTLGLYQTSFNIVSSLIATQIVLSGVQDIRNRRLLKYLGRLLVGCLFHTATILLIIPYILYPYRITMKRIIVLFISGAIIAVFFQRISGVIIGLTSFKYAHYLRRGSDNGMILAFHLIILAIVLIVHVVSRNKIDDYNKNDIRIHLWNVILEILFLLLAMGSNIFTRAAYFFMPSMPIFIDNAINEIDFAGNKKVLEICLIAIIGLQYIIRIQINNIGGSIPYILSF